MGELLSPEVAQRDVGQCWGDAEGQEHGAASRAPQKYSALGAPPPLLAIHLLQSPHPGVGTSQGCAKASCRGHGGRVGTGQRGGSILPPPPPPFSSPPSPRCRAQSRSWGIWGQWDRDQGHRTGPRAPSQGHPSWQGTKRSAAGTGAKPPERPGHRLAPTCAEAVRKIYRAECEPFSFGLYNNTLGF